MYLHFLHSFSMQYLYNFSGDRSVIYDSYADPIWVNLMRCLECGPYWPQAENGHGTDGWKHSICILTLGRGFGAADQTPEKTLQRWGLMSLWASEEPSMVLGQSLTHRRCASLSPPQPHTLPPSSCSCLASSAINTGTNKKATNKCFQMSKAFPWVL